jgi:WD40 repeat protein
MRRSPSNPFLPANLAEHTSSFVGRDWVFERLDGFLSGPERTFLLTGGPGTGKSTLAARLVEMSRGDEPAEGGFPHLGEGAITYAHFCRRGDLVSIDPLSFVKKLSERLALMYEPFRRAITDQGHTEIHVEQEVTRAEAGAEIIGIGELNIIIGSLSPRVAFLNLVQTPLEALRASGMSDPLVILVDGLDEALGFHSEESETLVGVLSEATDEPEDLTSNVKFILTSRPDQRVTRFFRPSLDLIRDAPPEVDDVRSYVKRRLEDSEALRIESEVLAQRIALASQGNFLYARYVVDELLLHPDHYGGQELPDLPEELEGIYRRFLQLGPARNREAWEESYRPVLAVLAVALGDGLTATQVASASDLDQDRADDALADCLQFLSGPDVLGRYRIYHESFREFLLSDSTYKVYPPLAHRRLAAALLEDCGGRWFVCGDPYALAHTPTHLLEAIRGTARPAERRELLERLAALFSDFGFLEAKTGALGVDEVIRDLRRMPEVLPELLGNVRFLEATAHQLGVDTVLADLRRRPELTVEAGPLSGILRVIDREAHALRGWDGKRRPAAFAQQIVKRAVEDGLPELASAGLGRLRELGGPYLELQWRRGPESNALARTMSGHDGAVLAAAMTPDAQLAVSGSADRTVVVWEPDWGREVRRLRGHRGWIRGVALTEDGRTALSASTDGTVKVWDMGAGRERATIGTGTSPVLAVAVTPDGRVAAWGCADQTVRIWDLQAGREVASLSGHRGSVYGVALTEDGRTAISGSLDGTVKVWDIGSARIHSSLNGPNVPVLALAITPDGRTVVWSSTDGIVRVCDLATGSVAALEGHDRWVRAVAVTPDGRRAISGSGDLTLRVWDLTTRSQVRQLAGHGRPIRTVAVTPDGRWGLSGSDDGTLKLWDLEAEWKLNAEVASHRGPVRAVVLMADRKRTISASYDGTLKLWDLTTGEELMTLSGHEDSVRAVTVSNDCTRAVSGSYDQTLRVWDLATGQAVATLIGHRGPIRGVAFVPGDRLVVSASDDATLKVWDVQEAREIRTLHGHEESVRGVAITPGGRAVSGSWDRTIRVWDLDTGEEVLRLGGHQGPIFSVDVGGDGRLAVSGSADRTARVWDLQQGKEISVLEGHRHSVEAVAIASDGRWIASGSYDRTLRVWDRDHEGRSNEIMLDGEILGADLSDEGVVVAGDRAGNVYRIVHFAAEDGSPTH